MRFEYPPSAEEVANNSKLGVEPSYHIDLNFEERAVEWSFYLPLPEGMHWKKGDEMGLGATHHERTQSFDEFISKPYKNIPQSLHQDILKYVV